jgi:hypothetical protein
MNNSTPSPETYRKTDELIRVLREAVRRAQQENRERGIPNVYSINGVLHYELPDGSLSTTDPFIDPTQKASESPGSASNPPPQ